MISLLMNRLKDAVTELDLGIPNSMFYSDPLVATNRALRAIGSPSIDTIKEYPKLLRAVLALEGAEEP